MKPKLSFGPHFFLHVLHTSLSFTFASFSSTFILFFLAVFLWLFHFCLTLDFILILLCFALVCSWFLFRFFSLLFFFGSCFIIVIFDSLCYVFFGVHIFFAIVSLNFYCIHFLHASLISFSSRFPHELDLNYCFYFILVTFGS